MMSNVDQSNALGVGASAGRVDRQSAAQGCPGPLAEDSSPKTHFNQPTQRKRVTGEEQDTPQVTKEPKEQLSPAPLRLDSPSVQRILFKANSGTLHVVNDDNRIVAPRAPGTEAAKKLACEYYLDPVEGAEGMFRILFYHKEQYFALTAPTDGKVNLTAQEVDPDNKLQRFRLNSLGKNRYHIIHEPLGYVREHPTHFDFIGREVEAAKFEIVALVRAGEKAVTAEVASAAAEKSPAPGGNASASTATAAVADRVVVETADGTDEIDGSNASGPSAISVADHAAPAEHVEADESHQPPRPFFQRQPVLVDVASQGGLMIMADEANLVLAPRLIDSVAARELSCQFYTEQIEAQPPTFIITLYFKARYFALTAPKDSKGSLTAQPYERANKLQHFTLIPVDGDMFQVRHTQHGFLREHPTHYDFIMRHEEAARLRFTQLPLPPHGATVDLSDDKTKIIEAIKSRTNDVVLITNTSAKTQVPNDFLRAQSAPLSLRFDESCLSITAIGRSFLARSSITQIDFTNLRNVREIKDGFLSYCDKLLFADLRPITGNVETIDRNFLSGCELLSRVEMFDMSAVTSIDDGFLSSCTALVSLGGLGCSASSSDEVRIGQDFLDRCKSLLRLDLTPFRRATFDGMIVRGCDALMHFNAHNLWSIDETECYDLREMAAAAEARSAFFVLPLHFYGMLPQPSADDTAAATKYFEALTSAAGKIPANARDYIARMMMKELFDFYATITTPSAECWGAYFRAMTKVFMLATPTTRKSLCPPLPEWLLRLQTDGIYFLDFTDRLRHVPLRHDPANGELHPIGPNRITSPDWYRVPPTLFPLIICSGWLHLCYFTDCNLDVLRTPSGLAVKFRSVLEGVGLEYAVDPFTPPELWNAPYDPEKVVNFVAPVIEDPMLLQLQRRQREVAECRVDPHQRLLQSCPPPKKVEGAAIVASTTSAPSVATGTAALSQGASEALSSAAVGDATSQRQSTATMDEAKPLHPASVASNMPITGTLSGSTVICEYCHSKRMSEIDSFHKHMESQRHQRCVYNVRKMEGLTTVMTMYCRACNYSPVNFGSIDGMTMSQVLPHNKKGTCNPGCDYTVGEFDPATGDTKPRRPVVARQQRLDRHVDSANRLDPLMLHIHSCPDAVRSALKMSSLLQTVNLDGPLDAATRFAKTMSMHNGEQMEIDLIMAIHLMTQDTPLNAAVNEAMTSPNRNEYLRPLSSFVFLYLKALHNIRERYHQSTRIVPLRLHRRVVAEKFPEELKEGGEVVWWGFNSALAEQLILLAPPSSESGKVVIQMRIESFHAIDITKFSATRNEPEYILLPGTKLRVETVTKISNSLYEAVLREDKATLPEICERMPQIFAAQLAPQNPFFPPNLFATHLMTVPPQMLSVGGGGLPGVLINPPSVPSMPGPGPAGAPSVGGGAAAQSGASGLAVVENAELEARKSIDQEYANSIALGLRLVRNSLFTINYKNLVDPVFTFSQADQRRIGADAHFCMFIINILLTHPRPELRESSTVARLAKFVVGLAAAVRSADSVRRFLTIVDRIIELDAGVASTIFATRNMISAFKTILQFYDECADEDLDKTFGRVTNWVLDVLSGTIPMRPQHSMHATIPAVRSAASMPIPQGLPLPMSGMPPVGVPKPHVLPPVAAAAGASPPAAINPATTAPPAPGLRPTAQPWVAPNASTPVLNVTAQPFVPPGPMSANFLPSGKSPMPAPMSSAIAGPAVSAPLSNPPSGTTTCVRCMKEMYDTASVISHLRSVKHRSVVQQEVMTVACARCHYSETMQAVDLTPDRMLRYLETHHKLPMASDGHRPDIRIDFAMAAQGTAFKPYFQMQAMGGSK